MPNNNNNNKDIEGNKKVKKKSYIFQIIGAITALIIAGTGLLTAHESYIKLIKEKNDKVTKTIKENNEQTDYVMQQIIDKQNERLLRLETYLAIALQRGAFKDLEHSNFTNTRMEVTKFGPEYAYRNLLNNGEMSDKMALSVKPLKNDDLSDLTPFLSLHNARSDEHVSPGVALAPSVGDLKLKSVEQYKKDFKASQQTK